MWCRFSALNAWGVRSGYTHMAIFLPSEEHNGFLRDAIHYRLIFDPSMKTYKTENFISFFNSLSVGGEKDGYRLKSIKKHFSYFYM